MTKTTARVTSGSSWYLAEMAFSSENGIAHYDCQAGAGRTGQVAAIRKPAAEHEAPEGAAGQLSML